VLAKGFNSHINAFTRTYGSDELDASLLLLPLFGFLAADDPCIAALVDAIEHNLMPDGPVPRYRGDVRGAVSNDVTTCRTKARFWHAACGSRQCGTFREAAIKRVSFSSAFWRCETTSASSRRNMTRVYNASAETFLRRCRTLRLSMRRGFPGNHEGASVVTLGWYQAAPLFHADPLKHEQRHECGCRTHGGKPAQAAKPRPLLQTPHASSPSSSPPH
jgi:hypothetical protein